MEDSGKDLCCPLLVRGHSPPPTGSRRGEGGHDSHLSLLGVCTSGPLPVTAQSSYHMSLSPSSLPPLPVSVPSASASAPLPVPLSSGNKGGTGPSSPSQTSSPRRPGSSHPDSPHLCLSRVDPSAPTSGYSSCPSATVTVSSCPSATVTVSSFLSATVTVSSCPSATVMISSCPSATVTVSSYLPGPSSFPSNPMARCVGSPLSPAIQPGPASPPPHPPSPMSPPQGQHSPEGSKHTSTSSAPLHGSPQAADEDSCADGHCSHTLLQTSLDSQQLLWADTTALDKHENKESVVSSVHGLSCLTGDSDSPTHPDRHNHNKTAAEHSDFSQKPKGERKCPHFLDNVNSDDDFCGKDQKPFDDRTVKRKSNSYALSNAAAEIDKLDALPLSTMRHSSVRLWSLGDTDIDSDSMDSDESSDDYCPTSRAQRRKGKRKGHKQLNKSGSKRAKWSSVNNGVHSNSKQAARDGDKKQSRKGPKNKSGKTRRKVKKEQLIEGVHYIVIGKFKGHRIMLVKLERVKVTPSDRVKVSDWQGRKAGKGVKSKARLLGPRCCRLANGISASHPSLLPQPSQTSPGPHSGPQASAGLVENMATACQTQPAPPLSLHTDTSRPEEIMAVKENGNVNSEGSQHISAFPQGEDLQHCPGIEEQSQQHNGTLIPEQLQQQNGTLIPEQLQQHNGTLITEQLQQHNGTLIPEQLQQHNGTLIPEQLQHSDTGMTEQLQQENNILHHEELQQNNSVNVEELQPQYGKLDIVELQQRDSINIEEQRNSINGEESQESNGVNGEESQQCNNNVDGKELQKVIENTDRRLVQEAHENSGSLLSEDTVKLASLQLRAMVARQRKRKKGLYRVPSAPCNLQCRTWKEADSARQRIAGNSTEGLGLQGTPMGRGQFAGEEVKGEGRKQDRRRPASSISGSFVGSEEGESSQEGSTTIPPPPPPPLDMDTDSRIAASESTSHTQSPVPRLRKLSSHLPFTISEHSQDADCSSLPQSNPDSTSSSPAFPRMALTHTDSRDQEPSAAHPPSTTQTPSAARLTSKEVCVGDHRSPAPLRLQSVCQKVKESRASHRAMEASSDSSDSQDGVDEELAYLKDQHKSAQARGFSWKDKLQFEDGGIVAEMDKDKLKKQKKLTPNQRLGVAFLSKRRRKGKVKGGSVRSEGGGGSSKGLDSLSLLHMATLASLGAKADSSGDTYRCTSWRLVHHKVEEKENHHVATLQHSADNLQWKTFSFCAAGGEKREGKGDGGVGGESLLNPEKCPDFSDVQAMEEEVSLADEASTVHSTDPGLSLDTNSKSMGAGQDNKDNDDSSDETDDYQISESLENVRVEKLDSKTVAKRNGMSSESSDDHVDTKSESRSDDKMQSDASRSQSCDYKPPLYEDSDDKTDDYTVIGPLKRMASRQPSDYRTRRVKRKARGSRTKSSKSSKVLDSLDMLHMATLASLGTDPPPLVNDDTLPRYSDSVWDHTDDYEESLIKMAYTSPVPSDLADLSPPLPLSPEDLSKVNVTKIQKQRPMPCRLKVDESRGTRNVCMAQVRAENAVERMSRLFVPLSRPGPQGSFQVNGAAKGSILGGTSPRLKPHSAPVLCRSASQSAAYLGSVSSPSVFVDRTVSSQTLPFSCAIAQPSIPNPDKLPPSCASAQPSIPNPDKLPPSCASAQPSIPNPDKLPPSCASAQPSIPNPDKLPPSCASAQPSIPNPDKLPPPSIPWHHPLHVVTDCAEGQAWKEQVSQDISTKKVNRCAALGNTTSPSLTPHFKDPFYMEDRRASASSGTNTQSAASSGTNTQSAASLKSPPLSTRLGRDNRRTQPSSSASLNHLGERTSPRVWQSDTPVPRRQSVSGGPLGEIHNHVGSRPLPFSSLAQRYAQRDRGSERIPSVPVGVSELHEGDWEKSCGIWLSNTSGRNNTHPCQSDSNTDPYGASPASSKQSSGGGHQWSSHSPSSRKESEGSLYCNTNKSPPITPFSPRGLYSMGPKTSPYGSRFSWSRSLDSRDIRSQRDGEVRSQRDGESRSQRDEEVRNQRDGEVRNQRDGEVRNQRDEEVRNQRDDYALGDRLTAGVGVNSQPPSAPSKWLCDISNMGGGPPSGNPSPVSHPHLPSSHHSPRLSRTEKVISQIFNLESASNPCKPSETCTPHKSPHTVQGDRWPDSKLGMDRNAWKPLPDQERESHRLQRQHSTELGSPASASWEQPPICPSESSECSFASSQTSAGPCLMDSGKNLPSLKCSTMTHPSPVVSKYEDSVRSSFTETPQSHMMFPEREKPDQSSSAVFCDSSPLAGHSQSAGWYKPTSSPSQSHQIKSDPLRSSSAYQVNALGSVNSPRGCSSSTSVSKWPGYSCENQSSFMLKSASFHSSDRCKEDGKSPVSFGVEKNLYRSTSCSTNVMDRNMNGVKLAESGNKDVFGSTSPMGCSPSLAHSSLTPTSRSPCRGSPRSKQWESTKPNKPYLWHPQSRKRSVGEYLEEMIESAYGKVPAEESPYGWSQVSRDHCGYPVKCSSESSYTPAMTANGLTSSVLDLSLCSGKIDGAGLSVSSGLSTPAPSVTSVPVTCTSCPPVHVPSGYAMAGVSSVLPTTYHTNGPLVTAYTTTVVSCTSSVPSVCSTTQNTSRPTWTTIKTDDFENITDDEDEEVIPSSQGYSTNVYRFPGFRRLSSISSSWTPYSVPSQQSLSAVSMNCSQASKDTEDRADLSQPMMSSHRYISNLYGYTKGLYSQCSRVSQPSQLNYGQSLGQVVNREKKYRGEGGDSAMPCSQKEDQGMVSSLGTPWQESQPSVSVPTSTLMSQFEPITDSEEEEEKGSVENIPSSHTRTSHYISSVSSAAFPQSTFFPVRSHMTSSAYSALGGSVMALTSSIIQPLLHNKPLMSSALLSQTGLCYTAASDGLLGGTGKGGSVESWPSTQGVDPLSGGNAVPDTLGDKRVLLCGEGGGEKREDSEPEDGGGRKRKKGGGASPTDRPPSSHQGPRREKREEEERSDNRGSGWPRTPEEPAQDPWRRDTSGQVLCPRAPPPSRQVVEASAASVGLSVEPVQPAFCSHPPDLPDTPRELGGRVLRLPTNMVRELEELPPSGEGRGLGAWQSLKASENPLLSSQPHPSSLSLRLQTEPQLRFVLAGDGPCVITPVRPPPRHSQVTSWLQDMMQTMAPRRCPADLKGEATEGREEAWGTDRETSMPLDIDLPGEDVEDQGTADSSDEETSIFTRLRDRPRQPGQKTQRDDGPDPISHGNSTPKRQCLDPEVLHSTPLPRSSSDLFDVTFTPISGGQPGETSDSQFVTPARPPLRRLSTNTQAALTRAMMTADRRQQSLEGETSQIDAPTPKNSHGFKVTQQNLQDAKALHKHQFLTVLSIELHADSRGDLMPDPEVDAIRVVFYAVFDDIPPERGRRNVTGAIVVDKESCQAGDGSDGAAGCGPSTSAETGGRGKRALFEKCGVVEDLDVVYVPSERDLIHHLADFIVRLDPDILLGFEVQQMSWGFLLQRAAQLSINLCSHIARIHGSKQGSRFSAEKDEWGADHTSEIHIEGRIVLNLWRLLRHEVTLNIYSYENCAFHILHRRVPAFTFRTLTSWYDHGTHLQAWRVVDHYLQRVQGQLAMLDQLDLIGKTSEFARVFGIEFYDVLSRGTQYRVESMMLRLAKPLNFIPVSPSVQQRARQKAAECIPLTLEPQSQLYTDPVVVLDFQSLYPSIMIAYNYCFSTCLGQLDHLARASEGPFEFGCTSLNIAPETLKKVRKHVTISPNGCVFVTGKVRKGVLPMMVEEILQTRLMVKKSMKDYKDDKTLHRLLDARQLGLKLIANVTYGYTGASFSGRMPCIEVGDSIVRKARESLERAIQLVEDTEHWRAQVVYGDTDSLFIRLPGRSKDEAFVLGQEIADTVTNMFPKPMKLKFEKVYLPCVLQTKKRYVGFMYESRDQQEAVFDAKGIETVRRDNCGVVSKVLERCIKILFTQRDVSLVRAYLHRQLTKMLSGRVGLQDYVFAKEYRGMMGYKPGACVPALEIARKRLRADRRGEPRVGERVPYVIVHGSPGLPLIQLVRQPRELLRDPSLRINVTYYITKQVLPPLHRLLSLVGVSVFQWYSDMPKVVRLAPHIAPDTQRTRQGTISQYFVTSDCLVCEGQTKEAVCVSCRQDPQLVTLTLASRSANYERLHNRLAKVCHTCMGVQDKTQPCVSLDCPVLFRRHLATVDLARADLHREALIKLTSF